MNSPARLCVLVGLLLGIGCTGRALPTTLNDASTQLTTDLHTGDASSDSGQTDLLTSVALDLLTVDLLAPADMTPPPPFVELDVSAVFTHSGGGVVLSTPSAIDCGAQCTAQIAYGETVTLVATASAGSAFVGWSGDCAGSNKSCSLSMTQARNVTATFDRVTNYVFVTSQAHDGDFGGLAGADAWCQTQAMSAGLPGTYIALLSTEAVDAISRLAGYRGWMRVDGKPFTDTPENLFVDREVLYPPSVDEMGNTTTDWAHTVFTGTDRGGVVYQPATCRDWTSSSNQDFGVGGNPTAGSITWHLAVGGPCQYPYRLYCFEVDFDVPLTYERQTGSIAFETTDPFVPGGGLAAADAQCASEALAAGLPPGAYLALLASDGIAASSRFDITQPGGWVRLDGVEVATSRAALFNTSHLDAAINVSPTGVYLEDRLVWLGGVGDLNTVGTSADTCQGWTTSSSMVVSGIAENTGTDLETYDFQEEPCNSEDAATHLLCLQD